jgi:hypothetical protein
MVEQCTRNLMIYMFIYGPTRIDSVLKLICCHFSNKIFVKLKRVCACDL